MALSRVGPFLGGEPNFRNHREGQHVSLEYLGRDVGQIEREVLADALGVQGFVR
jgi:hypothetical protein